MPGRGQNGTRSRARARASGRAAAETFARQGARVAVADINEKGREETVQAIRQAGARRRASRWT